MQKVECPITIVQSEGLRPCTGLFVKNELRAMPVTTPGRAIGRTSRKVIASRPKKRNRLTAVAAAVPRTSAIVVAIPAAFSDRTRALRASSLCHAAWNHFVLNPAIGQLWMLDELNAYTQIRTSGIQRNRTTRSVQKPSDNRAARVSTTTPRTRLHALRARGKRP